MNPDKLEYFQKLVETHRNETAECMNIVKDFQKDYEKINTIFEDQDKLEASLQKLEEEMKQNLSLHNDRLKYLESYLLVTQENFARFETIIDSMKELEKDLESRCEALFLRLKSLTEKNENLESLIAGYYEAMQKNKVVFDKFQQDMLVDLNNLGFSHQENLKAIDKIKADYDSKLAILEEKQALQDSLNRSVENQMVGNFHSFFNELKVLSARVKKIEEPVIVEAPVDTTKDDIEALKKQFSSIQLDLQNNNLKSANSATQFQIIEKKIENIYLLLKKIELGAKE